MTKQNFGVLTLGLMLMLSSTLGVSTMSFAQENTWTEKAEMPTPRFGLATVTVNGKIYAIGGDAALPSGEFGVSTVEVYDSATNTWTEKAEMPTARYAVRTAVVEGKIYAIGGLTVVNHKNQVLSVVEEYEPITDRWVKKAEMPTPRGEVILGVVNGKIYAIGGFGNNDVPVSAVEMYDPMTDTWTGRAAMPTPRTFMSTAVVEGKIYAIGGWAGKFRDIGTAFSTVEVYDPSTDMWTSGTDMPTPRCWLSGSAVDGRIYVIGGARDRSFVPLSTVEEYDTGFTPASSTPWDVNSDGTVNIFDLVQVASQFGQQSENLAGDVTGDGVVNLFDLVTVASHFGENIAAAP